ncbi:MAG: hypothetical protein J0L66_08860 [Cytophagales bacterium]|nr:hypothetical protein [Cytophagales bacterium]
MKGEVRVLLVMVLFAHTAFGQIVNVQGLMNEPIRVKKYEDISGSAYLYEDWQKGDVFDRSGKIYKNLLLRYDIYKDVWELNQEGQIYLLGRDLYTQFVIRGIDTEKQKGYERTFKAGYNQIEGFSPKDCFEVLADGKITLLKKHVIKFINEVTSNYGTATEVKRFQPSVKYFLLAGERATEVKLNQKSLREAAAVDSDFSNFLNKENSKIKSEADLTDLISNYNR